MKQMCFSLETSEPVVPQQREEGKPPVTPWYDNPDSFSSDVVAASSYFLIARRLDAPYGDVIGAVEQVVKERDDLRKQLRDLRQYVQDQAQEIRTLSHELVDKTL